MGRQTDRRKKAQRRGLWSERLAALSLALKGWRILSMRHRTPLGEIDLLARKGDLVIVVEVKARREVMAAIDAVSHASQRRIRHAADLWLARQPDHAMLSLRFDIIAVRPWRWPVHFEDAFRLAACFAAGADIHVGHPKRQQGLFHGPHRQCRRPDGPRLLHQHCG